MSQRIRVYGKPGCEVCVAAKQKLELLGLSYEFIDSEAMKLHELHEGWRNDESINFTAAYEFYFPNSLPLLRFGEGDFVSYSEGMKLAKQLAVARPKAVVIEPVIINFAPAELALA